MNVSSSQPCVTICCGYDMNYPSEARCYWNVSFSSEQPTFLKVFDLTWASRIGPTDLLGRNETGCPSNPVCFSDCTLGHNISTLFGNDMTSMNDLIDGGLTCRLDAEDHCFGTYIPDGTKNIISVCTAFLTLVVHWNLTLTWMSEYDMRPFTTYTTSISLPFFVATFVVYTIVPELKNLHGLMLRTYILCCFGFFLSNLIMLTGPSQTSCNLILALFWHFAFLAIYFWLNVMSFDIWWTFRSMRKCSDQSTRKKYIIYSGYAWGSPMLIIGIALIRELEYYLNGIVQGIHTRCWIKDTRGGPLYFSVPATIVTLCNICLFVLTTINIMRQKKATAQSLEGSDSRRYNEEKNRYYLHLKLFILMGMMYIAGVLPFIAQVQFPRYIIYILLCPEFLAGPIIFILFVWNDRTKRLLANHLGVKDWVVTQLMESAFVRIRTLLRRPQE